MNLLMMISIINTKLRDTSDSFEDICYDLDIDLETLEKELDKNNYYYDFANKQIKQK